MREFTIGKTTPDSGWTALVPKTLPLLPPPRWPRSTSASSGSRSTAKGSKRDARLAAGDMLQLYINDEFFDKPSGENMPFYRSSSPSWTLSMRTKTSCWWISGPAWWSTRTRRRRSTPSSTTFRPTSTKKEWNPKWENAFAPALCNRIDRNTGGIVIAAKNAEALRIINEKIRDQEMEKSISASLSGGPGRHRGTWGFLLKDEAKKQVSFYRRPNPRRQDAVTLYQTLETRGPLSLVECGLLTGRTHQIRVSIWRTPAVPCWATASMAGGGQQAVRTKPGRPCTPTSWPSLSPPTPGR